MTLRRFLSQSKITLDKKQESKLGELISDLYRERFSVSAPKTSATEIDGLVNDYQPSFLENCEETIIQFLTEKKEA